MTGVIKAVSIPRLPSRRHDNGKGGESDASLRAPGVTLQLAEENAISLISEGQFLRHNKLKKIEALACDVLGQMRGTL